MRTVSGLRASSIFMFGFGIFCLGILAAEASPKLSVVAAENFYGDIARQIGGERVSVVSIMSDPNIDPHEYEADVDDARAMAGANLVIENGGGYDDWMDKLLAASASASRAQIKGFDVAPVKLPENEHVWYSIDNAAAIADAIAADLAQLQPSSAAAFKTNAHAFRASLAPVKAKIAQIAARWAGTPVGLTETILLYQTGPMGLKVLTPFEFQKAIAEGNDPPADKVLEAEKQITQRQIRVLLYNEQTVSALTTRLQEAAKKANVPVVGVTETMPLGETYQSWMMRQLDQVRMALISAGS